MINNKKAFSFVELIITISIVVLLSVIAYTVYNGNNNKTNNAKIESETITLKNALLNYSQENSSLPEPNGNRNFFKANSSYAHHTGDNAFGVYGSVTEKTLPKKYIDTLPLDPVSNHYFSYGKTLDNKYFEIASVLRNSENYQTKLDGTYPGEYGPISLIREYNGSIFISDKSQNHLPYNPNEHILIVTDNNKKIYRVGDTISTTSSETKTLYFSDGSVSELKPNSSLTISELDFKNPKNNLLTTVKLFLSSGEIFTKATSLSDNSDFEIYTADTTAAVRGTIFSVKYISSSTKISVLKGQVEVQTKSNTPTDLNPITPGTGKKIKTEEQTQDNTTIIAIDSTIKTELEFFANVKNAGNEPIKNVTYIAPTTLANCDGTLHGDSKNFWNTGSVDSSDTCPSPESFTCNNGTWENLNGKNKNNYTFTNCTVGPAHNCDPQLNYTYNGHTYNIPTILHNVSQTNDSNPEHENNGDFIYTLSLTCNNNYYVNENETLKSFSCDTGYHKGTNNCIINNWVTGNWSSCSETCGGGTQTRSVTCNGGTCLGTLPATSRSCNTQACPVTTCTIGNLTGTKEDNKCIVEINNPSTLNNLNLGSEFEIEVEVKGSVLKSNNTTYLINNNNLFLKKYNNALTLGYKNGIHDRTVKFIRQDSLNTLNINNNYKIKIKINGNSWNLNLENLTVNNTPFSKNITNLNNLNFNNIENVKITK